MRKTILLAARIGVVATAMMMILREMKMALAAVRSVVVATATRTTS
jgi:hypothetical protein